MMPNTENGRATLAGLQSDVKGLERVVSDIAARMDQFMRDVWSKINKGPNLAVWFSGAALIVTVGMFILTTGGVWTSQRIAPVEKDILRLEHVFERMAKSLVENDKEIKATMEVQRVEARNDRNAIRDEARAERLLIFGEFKETRRDWLASLERLQASIVTRGEHEQRWAAFTAALAAVDRRLDETRKQVADISSPQSSFDSIRSDVRELRQRLDLLGPARASPPQPSQ
jgi:hypothetical protein